MNSEIEPKYPGISPELAALLAESQDVASIDQGRLQRAGEKLHDDPSWRAEGMKSLFVNEMLIALDEEGISQSELASKLGKTRQYVSKVFAENKRINFTIETMNSLAHSLNRRIELIVYKPQSAMGTFRFITSMKCGLCSVSGNILLIDKPENKRPFSWYDLIEPPIEFTLTVHGTEPITA